MADPKDVEATKLLRREFNRRQVDLTLADLRVSHGVAYIRGTLRPMRGAEGDLHSTVEHICKALRARPEFRDIVVDATFRT